MPPQVKTWQGAVQSEPDEAGWTYLTYNHEQETPTHFVLKAHIGREVFAVTLHLGGKGCDEQMDVQRWKLDRLGPGTYMFFVDEGEEDPGVFGSVEFSWLLKLNVSHGEPGKDGSGRLVPHWEELHKRKVSRGLVGYQPK